MIKKNKESINQLKLLPKQINNADFFCADIISLFERTFQSK